MASKIRETLSATDNHLDKLMIGDVYHVSDGTINFRTLVFSPTYNKTSYQLFMIDGILQYQDDYGTKKFTKATHAYNVWINQIIMSE